MMLRVPLPLGAIVLRRVAQSGRAQGGQLRADASRRLT